MIDVHGPSRRRAYRSSAATTWQAARWPADTSSPSATDPIGFVADSFENPYGFTSSRDRYEGFTDVLRDLGVEVEAALGAHGSRTARDLALRLLTGRTPPTAIFAASDTQALGVLSAARDLGLPSRAT